MGLTTVASSAIVIHGNDEAFVSAVADSIPSGHEAVVFVVGPYPAQALSQRKIAAVELDGQAGHELESGRYFEVGLERLSLALEPYGDRVIAVLHGDPGTGDLSVAHAVKRSGGTVIALVDSGRRPDRAASAFVDLFLTPSDLPAALGDMLADPLLQSNVGDEEQLRAFLRQLRQRTGIDFAQYKMATIRRRLQRLMISANAATLADFSRYLQSHPDEYQRIVHEFLIKVTDFFRDEQLFEYLRSEVLPEIIARVRAENGEVRIWSAGCATGEEAYSLAILLAEIYGPELETANVKIFATDLDESAIAFARQGVYPLSALGAMPSEWVAKYFTKSPRGYEVRKSIRSITVFGQHDLGQRAPFPRTDLVLCRNVLIYFTKELQQRTLQLFAFSLRDGGFLVLGKSETISPAPESFRPVHSQYRTFQRYGERVLIPPPRTREPYAVLRERPEGEIRPGESRIRGSAEAPRSALFERFGASIFAGSSGYAVIDRRYDVVAINAAGRRLLGIVGLGVGEDLIHLVHGAASAELRALVDLGFKGVEDSREIDMTEAPLAAKQRIRATILPERLPDGGIASGAYAMLRVEDVSAFARDLEVAARKLRDREADVTRLEDAFVRLDVVRDAVTVANEQLSTANVELRSVNEHLMISVEEAESSTEEIETLNEEMQATNEELETLNEELQATIEELNTTNDELHVRGIELQSVIEERDRALERSSRRDEEFASIFAEMPVPAVHYRVDGSVAQMNDALLALLATHGDPLPLEPEDSGAALRPFERAARGEIFVERWVLKDGAAPHCFELRSKRLLTDGRGTILVLVDQSR